MPRPLWARYGPCYAASGPRRPGKGAGQVVLHHFVSFGVRFTVVEGLLTADPPGLRVGVAPVAGERERLANVLPDAFAAPLPEAEMAAALRTGVIDAAYASDREALGRVLEALSEADVAVFEASDGVLRPVGEFVPGEPPSDGIDPGPGVMPAPGDDPWGGDMPDEDRPDWPDWPDEPDAEPGDVDDWPPAGDDPGGWLPDDEGEAPDGRDPPDDGDDPVSDDRPSLPDWVVVDAGGVGIDGGFRDGLVRFMPFDGGEAGEGSLDAEGGMALAAVANGMRGLLVADASPEAAAAITTADALAVLRLAVGLPATPGRETTVADLVAADFLGSGTVTTADALAVLRVAVGLSAEAAPRYVLVEADLAAAPVQGNGGLPDLSVVAGSEPLQLVPILVGDLV